MGTACGPSVANLYLAYFEILYQNVLSNCLRFNFRYIDDVFFISHEEKNWNIFFKDIFPIKLNIESGKMVNFLDLKISFNYKFCLDFDVFIKPTNTFSFLNTSSMHPSFICKNIPKSLIFRYRRICSNLSDFYFHCSNLHFYLLKRGYKSKPILALINQFANKDRLDLIKYRDKKQTDLSSIFFCIFFDKHLTYTKTCIKQIWNNSLKEDSFLKNILINVYFKVFPNFNNYFVNNIKFIFSNKSFFKCAHDNCKVCKYTINDSILYNTFNLPILVPSRSTCTSTNCVYIISCIKCKKQYIGETKRTFFKRMSEHLYCILFCINNKNNPKILEKFLNDKKDQFFLYNHFSDSDHNLDIDLKFQIFVCNFPLFRTRLETDLMYLFNTLTPYGLNSKISCKLYELSNYKNPNLL
jgi:hypothetical protein